MFRRLLCWLGFHDWMYDDPMHFGYKHEICKHCEKERNNERF